MNKKILLIGDSCKDIYHYGTCERLSPEAPVPIFKESYVEIRGGMSSNVKNNLLSFGFEVFHLHNKKNIEKHRLFDTKFNHHLIRYDVGEIEKVDELENTSLYSFTIDIDAIIISDYDKGFLSQESIKNICKKYHKIPIFVDTKKNDLSCFQNCIIKLNETEYQKSKNININNKLIVTLGDKGALYNGKIYKTQKQEIFDVCGAGDVFLSSFVYKFLQNQNIEDSIIFANKCASFSVGKIGSYVLSQKDIDILDF
jgi:D-beta-D-heptose 7-phosphate kinase/D-beta-D-heptose 1-phosphate adenosyltransferase